MRRIEPQHETVEKAPPAGWAFDEQPVHLRRQPQDAEPFAERRLAARRLAIDADKAAFAAFRLAPGADADIPPAGHDSCRDGPASGDRLACRRPTPPPPPPPRGGGGARKTTVG